MAGYDHWSTPPEWIERIRTCMGSIDLDPCSNAASAEIVKAKNRYGLDIDKNGLILPWFGNVFCNPPYSAGNIDAFVDKAVAEWSKPFSHWDYRYNPEFPNAETVTGSMLPNYLNQMILLVNSATDTAWYHKLLQHCSLVLLVKGRIKFWKVFDGPEGYKAYPTWEGELSIERRKKDPNAKAIVGNSPRYLNTLFYFGRSSSDTIRFKDTFHDKGTILQL